MKIPPAPKLASRPSRKHGFEHPGLKAVLWRIPFRSAKIFWASARLRNCWTFSFRLSGGWNIACKVRALKWKFRNRLNLLTFFRGQIHIIWQVSASGSSGKEWTRISWKFDVCGLTTYPAHLPIHSRGGVSGAHPGTLAEHRTAPRGFLLLAFQSVPT